MYSKPGCEICICRHAAGMNEAVRRLAVHITSIIMMSITILLMIEDRCNTSFAKKMLAMYIIMNYR